MFNHMHFITVVASLPSLIMWLLDIKRRKKEEIFTIRFYIEEEWRRNRKKKEKLQRGREKRRRGREKEKEKWEN